MDRENLTGSALAIVEECDFLADILLSKNRQYGDSALNPVRIFSRASPVEQLLVRIDDKISRIRSGQDDDVEDTELDLAGYLILLQIARRKEVVRASSSAAPQPEKPVLVPTMGAVPTLAPHLQHQVENLGFLVGVSRQG